MIIAVEKGEENKSVVAWLSHGGTLIRAAPEHLRMVTSLETRTFDLLADMGSTSSTLNGQKYIDLGEIPTTAEERGSLHMQFDEPPPDDLGMSSGSGPPPSPPAERTLTRDELDAEGTPQAAACRTSASPSSSSAASSAASSESESSPNWCASLFPPVAGRSLDPGMSSGSQDQPRPEGQETTRSRSRTPPREARSESETCPSEVRPESETRPSEVRPTSETRRREVRPGSETHPREVRPESETRPREVRPESETRLGEVRPASDLRPLRSNQGQNANDVYFAQLADTPREAEYYLPNFTFTQDSKRASQIRGNQWETSCLKPRLM